MPIRYVDKVTTAKLSGVALLRLDFNAEDDWRMRAALPTMRLLTRRARAVLVLSHKGRPMKRDPELSLAKDAQRLARLLGKPVRFAKTLPEARQMLKAAARGGVIVLENLRFERGEERNDPAFARALAALGDYYVNDAFPVSHRANASVAAITKLLPSYGGLSLRQEIINLSHVIRRPKRPLVMVFGGAKISDKLAIFVRFRQAADRFLVGGALANTLLMLKGTDVGSSLVEPDVPQAREILGYRNMLLPVDFAWDGSRIRDIGPKTQALFAREIKKARTVVWNGPMGVFENKKFSRGTKAIWKAVFANRKAKIIVGGGETITSLKNLYPKPHTLYPHVFVSTGGGAMLEFLSGKKLPGIVALERKTK